MKRVILATGFTLLVLPSSAMAASTSGRVLSVDARHHSIEVVDSSHVVHAYGYNGGLPELQAGNRISFQRSGRTIVQVEASSSTSRTVSFYGRVVRASKHGFALRLADGKTVSFSAKQIRHWRSAPAKRRAPTRRHTFYAHVAGNRRARASSLTINLEGLQPGVTLLATETLDVQGNITISIASRRLPHRASAR